MKIKFRPRWNAALQGHAVNVIRKFYPRLVSDYEFDDLLQEAFIVYMRCKERYGATVDNPRWFMALFSRSLVNKLINLTEKAGRYISIEALDEDFPEPATQYDEAYMTCLLRELPVEVRQLIWEVVNGKVHDGRFQYGKLKTKFNL